MTDLHDALAQIKARAEKATEGPWGADKYSRVFTREDVPWGEIAGCTDCSEPPKRPDAEFIAHARTDVPRLVAAMEAVMKEAADADKQDRLISSNILRKRLTDKLTGGDPS